MSEIRTPHIVDWKRTPIKWNVLRESEHWVFIDYKWEELVRMKWMWLFNNEVECQERCNKYSKISQQPIAEDELCRYWKIYKVEAIDDYTYKNISEREDVLPTP